MLTISEFQKHHNLTDEVFLTLQTIYQADCPGFPLFSDDKVTDAFECYVVASLKYAYAAPKIKLSVEQIKELEQKIAKSGAHSIISVDIEDSVETQLDAERWRALMSCQRLRVLGSANLGCTDPAKGSYQHMGLEIWTEYNSEHFKNSPDNGHELAKKQLTLFADTIIKGKVQ